MPADRAHTPFPNVARSHTFHPNVARRPNVSTSHTARSSTSRLEAPRPSTAHSQIYHDYFDRFLFNSSKAEDHWASKDAMSLALRTQPAVDRMTQHLAEISEHSRSVHAAILNVAPAGELLENVRGSTTVLGLFETVEAFATCAATSSAQTEQKISDLITETRKSLALLRGDLEELQKIKGSVDALKKQCCKERTRVVTELGNAFDKYGMAIDEGDG